MKNLIKSLVNLLGYKLLSKENYNKLRAKENYNQMLNGLERLSSHIVPNTIIDVGAARGDWTDMALKFWPNSNYILIDPLIDRYIPISSIGIPNVKRIKRALGKRKSLVKFNITDDLYGSGFTNKNKGTSEIIEVEVDCLESLLEKNTNDKILLKLDTHGVEIDIFEGINESWPAIEAIIVEVYGFFLSPESKIFHEISDYLNLKGFRLYDIVDVMRREKDHAFWQADAVYLRRDHNIFKDNSFI